VFPEPDEVVVVGTVSDAVVVDGGGAGGGWGAELGVAGGGREARWARSACCHGQCCSGRGALSTDRVHDQKEPSASQHGPPVNFMAPHEICGAPNEL